MVYTPVKSVAIGGHFFAWDCLERTLSGRLVEIESEGSGTNAVHPAAFQWLARMAISLTKPGEKLSKILTSQPKAAVDQLLTTLC